MKYLSILAGLAAGLALGAGLVIGAFYLGAVVLDCFYECDRVAEMRLLRLIVLLTTLAPLPMAVLIWMTARQRILASDASFGPISGWTFVVSMASGLFLIGVLLAFLTN